MMVRAPICLMFAAVLAAAAGAGEFFCERPGEIRIRLSNDSIRLLRVDHRKYVAAEIQAFGKMWSDARVRLKGSGTFEPIDGKPSFTVELPEGKIHLNNSLDDPSCLNEFVGAHIARRAGFSVPRVSHAAVTVNGRELGLYVVKEGFDAPEVEVPDAADFERVIDLNPFCRFMALEVMMCHWDGYSLRGNNFHASKNAAGRIDFSPSGMDQLFGKADLAWKPDMTGAFARAVMATAEGRATYEEEFRKLFVPAFDSKEIRKMIEARVKALRPILDRGEFRRLCVETAELSRRIEARETYLKTELAGAVAGKMLKTEEFTGTVDSNRRL